MPVGNDKGLVYQVESEILRFGRITKLSLRKDAEYFTGRAGLIRILNMIFAAGSLLLMVPGFFPETLNPNTYGELIEKMRNGNFTGYADSGFTYAALAFGGTALIITVIFVLLLFFFMEVRCDLLWERINQKANVLNCVLSVAAAFCNVLSIQSIQLENCKEHKCEEEIHHTKTIKHDEVFYPPYFVYHYTAFVGFLTNAMLYSIASRIWLRNED